MALTLVTKIILATVAGAAVVTPVTYFAVNGSWGGGRSSVIVTYENYSKSCRHIPLKNQEIEKRLLVCFGTSKDRPVFKWWQKDGVTQEIETLSWKKKSGSTDSAFELQVKLKGLGDTFKEDGNTSYFPEKEIEKMESNCSFNRIEGLPQGKEMSEFRCKDVDDVEGNSIHTITTIEFQN